LPWTVQTIDRDGMVLNMAQTWHMLRPGEIRNNCGGCHAHSQAPTRFEDTFAAKPEYKVFDLTGGAPLTTERKNDESGARWDVDNKTGLRTGSTSETAEYLRDVQPILLRSCAACHTKNVDKPAGNLVLDDDDNLIEVPAKQWLDLLGDKPPTRLPGSYMRLAADPAGQFGHPSGLTTKIAASLWGYTQASRYVRFMQSRRSLLAWKIFGRRLDGFANDDFMHFREPGNMKSLTWQGKPFEYDPDLIRKEGGRLNLAFTGTEMPPRAAIVGTYVSPEGKTIKVPPLSDEDRRTIVRWIDLGCPIDLSGAQPKRGAAHANNGGWYDDENRPTVAITFTSNTVADGANNLAIRVGVYDGESGLDRASLRITADINILGVAAGENLTQQFRERDSVWSLEGAHPAASGRLKVTVRDLAGNTTIRDAEFPAAR
jgi:hypothetical protein